MAKIYIAVIFGHETRVIQNGRLNRKVVSCRKKAVVTQYIGQPSDFNRFSSIREVKSVGRSEMRPNGSFYA